MMYVTMSYTVSDTAMLYVTIVLVSMYDSWHTADTRQDTVFVVDRYRVDTVSVDTVSVDKYRVEKFSNVKHSLTRYLSEFG